MTKTRTAQSGYKFPEQKQSEVDGSPTKKNDSEMDFFVEADDLSKGGKSITYWAEEIVRSIRYNQGGDAKAAYDNVIKDARSQGLTKDQEQAIDNLLVRWHIPVPVGDFEKDVDPYYPVKSDYTLSFKQKQVAASLKAKREGVESLDSFLTAIEKYKANRKACVLFYRKAQMDQKITKLLKANFSREDVAEEIPKWEFPEYLKRSAIKALTPKKIVLASKRLSLTNDRAKNRKTCMNEALLRIAQASNSSELTPEQVTIMDSLRVAKSLESPYWIHKKEKSKDVRVFARLRDGRVLEATIGPSGAYKDNVYLDRALKIAIKKSFSENDGWVSYVQSRVAQKESMKGDSYREVDNTNEEEDTSPKFAQKTQNECCPRCKCKAVQYLGKRRCKCEHCGHQFPAGIEDQNKREEQLQDPLTPQKVDIEQLQGR